MVGLWNATISAIATRPPRKEADNDSVWCKWEDCRAVDCRTCIWNELLGDADKCSGNLSNELTDAVNKNGHTSSKLKTSKEWPNPPHIVTKVAGEWLVVCKGVAKVTGDKACNSNNVEQNNHEESNGEDKVLEELEELWKLLSFLLALLLVLLSKELSNVTGECITDAVEVANCDGISTNKLVYEWLAQRR